MAHTQPRSARSRWTMLVLLISLFFVIGCESTSSPPAPIEIPLDVTSKSAIKLLIDESGLYQVSLEELKGYGLNITALDYGQVSLSSGGEQVPYYINGSTIVFLGREADNRYSLLRPYILRTGTGGIQMTQQAAPDITSPVIESLPQEVRVEQNLRYEQRAAEFDGEVWFWKRIVHTGNDAKFDVTLDLPAVTGESAELIAKWWGLSYTAEVENDHDLDLLVNDQPVGTIAFNDQEFHQSSTTVNGALLTEGINKITIDNSAAGAWRVDQVYLDWVALRYFAPPVAINGRLKVSERMGLLAASGFSGMPLAVDTTNPLQPSVLANLRYEEGLAKVGIADGTTVEVVGPNGFLKPAKTEPLIETDLRSTSNQADLLIVTTRELAPSLNPLVAERQAQGLSVIVTLVDELYDEFNNGDISPDAINTFVRYAHTSWAAPKPSYLFIVGDATIDTQGYAANNPEQPIPQPRNLVPSPIVDVSFSGETVSDARLADLDGDNSPDMAVGRWPVDSTKEVDSLVKRTLAYEKGVSAENALFAFDASSSEFSLFTDNLIAQSQFPQQQADLYSGPTSNQVLDRWSEGAWIVSYVGHGGLKLWGKDEILTIDAAADIDSNKTPPIVLQFSCLTGHFAEFSTESITETMLKNDDGPVLLVASSGLTLSTHQSPFAIKLLTELQNPETKRMGDAFQMAKKALPVSENLGLQEISDTFGLIGDPSAIIVRPASSAVASQ